ncbi:MAG TPA: ATP-binding protein [Gaiellaceae bacterium]|nr:ATP-binding protein [Gaiellaceae bacterium]
MTDDQRLLAHLELLRLALRAYLGRLRALWATPGDRRADEVERLLVAVGTTPVPEPEQPRALERLFAASASQPGGLGRIVAAAGLGRGEELLAAAAWWAEADPQLAAVLGCAHDDAARRYASAALVRLLAAPYGIVAPGALDDEGPLVRFGVLCAGAGAGGALTPTPTARDLLAGTAPRPFEPGRRMPTRLEPTRDALARHLRAGRGGTVLLRGPVGAGRRALAAAAVRAAGLVAVAAERPAGELRLLSATGAGVPVLPAAAAADLGWSRADPPLIAWGGVDDRLPGAYVVDVRPPTRPQRTALWRQALADAGLDPATAPSLAGRFGFTEGDVADVIGRAALDAAWAAAPLDAERVWAAARRQPEHALGRLAALVTPTFTLDDLVLAEQARTQLGELVAHVALQHVVLDDWGFRRRLPRGQGVAALFAGPPGTGKTMAAEAIANELRQDLYRIDLSAVVSKYIGETEKNLALAFDEAERAGAVLFFDEADALFGKRTEVRDAHDRYANLEVNYLLQRVETFTGLVILASNRQAALDEAFLRRLRFTIRFELPEAPLRRELWRRAFPREARVGELGWDALAACELAGGSIQSAALAAAYLAAAAGEPVRAAHVERALRREYEKLGRAWPGLRPRSVAA